MELRHLRYFVAVAEELHFSRAAARLHIAQPPLSLQIRQLEDEIGVPLLERTKRMVALTAAGRAFLMDARALLGQLERSIEIAREIGTGQRGTLRLGSIYSAIYAVVPGLLRTLSKAHPDITVDLAEMTVQQQLDALKQGVIDIGILRSPIEDDCIETRPLFREGIVALVPSGHALAAHGSVDLRTLAQYPFLLSGIGPQSSFRQHVLGLFQRLGCPLKIEREIAEIHSIISLVGAGLGVALAPESVSRIRVEDVVYLRVEDETPSIEVSLAWRRGGRQLAFEKLFALIETPEVRALLPGAPADTGGV